MSADERARIAELLAEGLSQAEIARRLGRSPSTIRREIKRGRDPETGVYLPRQDQTPAKTPVAPPEPQKPKLEPSPSPKPRTNPEPSSRRSLWRSIGATVLLPIARGVRKVALRLLNGALRLLVSALRLLVAVLLFVLILGFVGWGVHWGGWGGGMFCWLFGYLVVGCCGTVAYLGWFLYKAKEVSEAEAPQLHALVARLADRAELSKPRVYVAEMDDLNAFSMSLDNRHAAVWVTSGLMRAWNSGALNDEELACVMAHELAHIKNRDSLISYIAMAVADAIFLFLWPRASELIYLVVCRNREYRADATGARICGHPLAMAEAWEKILDEDPPQGGKWLRFFSTHPPTRERVRRLREMTEGR